LVPGSDLQVKGPLNIIKVTRYQWITAYGHASQDDLPGIITDDKIDNGSLIPDAARGPLIPDRDRLPNGLDPKRDEQERFGIMMGLWLSPIDIDSTTQRYKDHSHWVIKDSERNPVKGQWSQPVFDFVSGFYNLFIDDCKKLVDRGARFFKWDAINTSLIAGHGLWGALSETSEKDRMSIHCSVMKSKQVLPLIKEIIPEMTGRVGSSPEIYKQVSPSAGAGQVISIFLK
jgi:hypothetical protein